MKRPEQGNLETESRLVVTWGLGEGLGEMGSDC